MFQTVSVVLVVIASACAEPRVAEVARGPAWVSAYWGYSTPKVVFDGTSYYTAGLWGAAPSSAYGVVYRYDGGRWQEGARLPDIYQPATLLLDAQSRLIVIYNMPEKPAVLLRSKAPGAIDDFERLPAPADMNNGYYLGAAIQEDRIYVAYVAMPSYSMHLTSIDLATNSWSPSVVMAEGQVVTKPKIAWTYPILVPAEDGLHVVASNTPDGGEGNTYDKVWYLFYPRLEDIPRNPSSKTELNVEHSPGPDLKGGHTPARRELVAQSPVGSTAYAMDMTVDAQDVVHVVHMWNIYKYGDPLAPDAAEPGVYDSYRDPVTGAWSHQRVAPVCIAGFWHEGDRLQLVYQDQGNLFTKDWDAQSLLWSEPRTVLQNGIGPGVPTFMDILSTSSGSKLPDTVAIVTSSTETNASASGEHILWSLLP